MAFKNIDEQIKSFLTPKGRDLVSLAKKYQLEKYYDPQSGTFSIPRHLYSPTDKSGIYNNVQNLITNEKDWVGNFDDDDNEYIYISEKGAF